VGARDSSWFRWENSALLLEVTIQPGAAKSEITGLHGDCLKIRIQAPPVDGKANRALTEFVAELFGASRSRVHLIRGQTSRKKTLKVDSAVDLPAELVALGLTK
jgi:uncharacterized protein (TIGR00251 family)